MNPNNWSLSRFASLLAAALASGGCGSDKDCAALEKGQAQAWCWYEVASEAAQDGELSKSVEAIQEIDDDMVKSAAIDKLFMAGPKGLDQQTAANLCNQLSLPYSDTCQRSWNRPHLWQQ